MAPPKLRYRVKMKDPLLNSTRTVATELTATDATKLVKLLNLVTAWKEEISD